jgi:hypothetical protein
MGRIGAVFFTVELNYDSDVIYIFKSTESHQGTRLQMFFGLGVKFGLFNRKVSQEDLVK